MVGIPGRVLLRNAREERLTGASRWRASSAPRFADSTYGIALHRPGEPLPCPRSRRTDPVPAKESASIDRRGPYPVAVAINPTRQRGARFWYAARSYTNGPADEDPQRRVVRRG